MVLNSKAVKIHLLFMYLDLPTSNQYLFPAILGVWLRDDTKGTLVMGELTFYTLFKLIPKQENGISKVF